MASSLMSSLLTPPPLSLLHNNNTKKKQQQLLSLQNQKPRRHHSNHLLVSCFSKSPSFNPLPLRLDRYSSFERKSNHDFTTAVETRVGSGKRASSVVCHAGGALTSPHNLQWISAIAALVLMIVRGTPINKAFLAPLFALQAPSNVISWIKGEYGMWTAFLALLVRLFFFIPGELELPFMALLLVIVAPHQVMRLRGKQEGAIISLFIVGFLGFQHLSGTGSLQRSFDQGPLVATLAIFGLAVVSCLLLI
ncbi:hypothetical protein Tsubulata_001615 [Turnera subulata]|uniref:Uncharacterized protein n=1 Tax=Turnera subulata TaxID=218843 RepID=A0A9Q0F0X3_9ROSI|nr:hypothetical protein Tsubulata_001615 [Turnera subulata]